MSEALGTQDCASTLLRIESRLTAVETDLKHTATKADIEKLLRQVTDKISDMQKWVIGFLAALLVSAVSAIGLAVVRLLFY